MPWFISLLIGGLYQAFGSFVTSLLIKLGVGFIVYENFNVLFSGISQLIWSNLDSAPSAIISIMSLLKVGSGINIVLSAITVRQALNGFNGTSIKKMSFK